MKVIFSTNFRPKTKKIVVTVFDKNIKVSNFGLIWKPFREYLQIKIFFQKFGSVTFLSFLTSCKKSEKCLELFLRKLRYQPTNQPTNQATNQPIITKNTVIIGPHWRQSRKHLETLLCKINKSIDLIYKLPNLSPRSALITLHKDLFVHTLIMVIFFMQSPLCIVSSEIRVSLIQCLFSYYWSNTRFIKGETIPKNRI